MGYYMGDYYEGDYYQGQFGALLRIGAGVLKKVGPKVGRLIGIGKKIVAKHPVAVGVGTSVAGSALAERLLRKGGGMGGGGGGGRRRMNVTNAKALRRAIRRARGFAKLARKVLTFPITKPPKGRALFKGKR